MLPLLKSMVVLSLPIIEAELGPLAVPEKHVRQNFFYINSLYHKCQGQPAFQALNYPAAGSLPPGLAQRCRSEHDVPRARQHPHPHPPPLCLPWVLQICSFHISAYLQHVHISLLGKVCGPCIVFMLVDEFGYILQNSLTKFLS